MEDKKLLTNEELEKVSGGSARLDENVRKAFHSAEHELENIIDNRANPGFRSNVNLMLKFCRQALSADNIANRARDIC